MADETTIKYQGKELGKVSTEKVIQPLVDKGVISADALTSKAMPMVQEKPIDVTKELNSVNIEASPLLAAQQAKLIQDEEKMKQNVQSQFGTTGATAKESLVSAINNRPDPNVVGYQASKESELGIRDKYTAVETQTIKATEAKNVITNLQAELQAKKEGLETTMTSRSMISMEQNKLDREYGYKIAKATATYASEAAMAEALNGNLNTAISLVDRAVSAYTADIKADIERFDTLYSVYADFVDDLDADSKNVLNTAYNELLNEKEKVEDEKKTVGNLMLQYTGAGISLDDSLEEALKKASLVSGDGSEAPQTIGSSATGYFEWDGTQWKKISGTQSSTSSDNDFTGLEKRKLEQAGINYNTVDGYKKALDYLYGGDEVDLSAEKLGGLVKLNYSTKNIKDTIEKLWQEGIISVDNYKAEDRITGIGPTAAVNERGIQFFLEEDLPNLINPYLEMGIDVDSILETIFSK